MTSYLISIMHSNANKTSVSWYDVTHDQNSQRITIPKRPINLYFLAFCGKIYQNLLHRQVYIAVSSQKLLLISQAKNCCISPLSQLHRVHALLRLQNSRTYKDLSKIGLTTKHIQAFVKHNNHRPIFLHMTIRKRLNKTLMSSHELCE